VGTIFVLILLAFFYFAGFTKGAGMSGRSVIVLGGVISALVGALVAGDGV
jgi:hypothetical protein